MRSCVPSRPQRGREFKMKLTYGGLTAAGPQNGAQYLEFISHLTRGQPRIEL